MASSYIQSSPFQVFPAGVCGGDQPEGELEEDWCVPAAQEDERSGGGRGTGEALKVKSLIGNKFNRCRSSLANLSKVGDEELLLLPLQITENLFLRQLSSKLDTISGLTPSNC